MTCSSDIATYNKIRSEQKLFQFLNALDRQREEGDSPMGSVTFSRRSIRGGEKADTAGVAAGLATNGINDSDGLGLVTRGQRRTDQNGKLGPSSRIDKTKLKCSHCGMSKHTKEQCFRIVGYPEWWTDGHKKHGKAAAAVGGLEVSGSDNNVTESGFGGIANGGGVNISGYQDGNDYWTWH